MWPFLPLVTFPVSLCQSPVSMCMTGRLLCSISHFLLPIPLSLTLVSNDPPTPLTFFILLSPALFTSLSGVRGMNCAGGFSCVTCWWRRCRDSPDTLCCCGTWQKGVRWTTRPKACRALQSKWTHLYVS